MYLFKRKENFIEEEIRDMNMLKRITNEETDVFQAYKISISYPERWHIYINSSKKFDYHDGFVKIDRSDTNSEVDKASMSLRWARLEKETNIDEYIKEVRIQYEKKQKKNKKDQFTIENICEVHELDHKAYLIESSITANHSIYRSFGRDERIKSIQITIYCRESGRIVIASISAPEEVFENQYSFYKKMLLSLKCH